MSTSVSDLAARPDADVGYVLFIEGVPLAFTTRAELAGEGVSSWINTTTGARRVIEGLLIDEGQTVTHSTSLESGMLSGGECSFTVEDFDEEIIAFMRQQDEAETVGEMLLPLDSPAPATLLSADGETLISLHGKFLNGEAIGAAGERNVYGVLPAAPMPGLAHCAMTGGSEPTLALSKVYSTAPFLEGRRVALYKIYRDVNSTAEGYLAWRSWSAHADALGDSLVFLGTMEKPTCEGRTWTFPCAGVSSLFIRQLNTSRPATWQNVSSTIYLSDEPGARSDLMGISLYYQEGGSGATLLGAKSYFDEALDTLPLTGTPKDYRDAITLRLATLMATAGDDITFGTFYNADVRMEVGYSEISIDDNGWAACALLLLPEQVLRYLGYAPDLQGKAKFENEGDLAVYTPEQVEAFGFAPPGPGYWGITLQTTPLGYSNATEALNVADNEGKPRRFQSRTAEGVDMLLPKGDQELLVGLGSTTPFIQGQLARAPGEHEMTDGGGDVDTCGFFAFKAKYDDGSGGDPIDMVQVAKCGWVNNDDFHGANFGENLSGYRQLWIESYLDPRWFGIDRTRLSKVWASLDLQYAPFAMVGYNLGFGDRADLILLRTMLSTGTATWTGYEGQNPVRTAGLNAHPDATLSEGDDVEIADLGLQIPASLIDYASFTKTASLLPEGGGDSPLNRVKFGFIGSFDAQELIARCLAPRGWAMGWVRGQFRLFSMAEPVTLEDVEVSIEPDDFAGNGAGAELVIEAVDFGPLTAKDKFKIEVGGALVEEAAGDEPLSYTANAHDPGARTRQGNAEHSMDGAGLIQTQLWKGAKNSPKLWGKAWDTLWAGTMAEFYGSAAVMVTVTLRWSKARLLGSGSIVRFSGYFAAGLNGQYSISNRVGRCWSISRNLMNGQAEVKILLQPGDATTTRRFAPIAWVLDMVDTVEERHDAASRTIYCYRDYFGTGNATRHDVSAFAEPGELNVGGDALIYGLQHNGREWDQTFSAVVESVSQAGDSITYKPGSLLGTFHEAQYTCLVMAPYDDQDAASWPQSLFAVHTRSNHKFGGVPTKGFKLIT